MFLRAEQVIANLPEPSYLRPNLTLSFTVADGARVTDSAGNDISGRRFVVIKASVRKPTRQPTDEVSPGAGTATMLLEGRLVEPKYLPEGISQESIAHAELKDETSGATITGDFRFLPTTQNRTSAITKKFGQRIVGELFSGSAS